MSDKDLTELREGEEVSSSDEDLTEGEKEVIKICEDGIRAEEERIAGYENERRDYLKAQQQCQQKDLNQVGKNLTMYDSQIKKSEEIMRKLKEEKFAVYREAEKRQRKESKK